jgi:hypothetical protein
MAWDQQQRKDRPCPSRNPRCVSASAPSPFSMMRPPGKPGAYVGKTNPESVDISTFTDAIIEKITGNPQARNRWFKKAGLVRTLEEHARQNARRAAEPRQSPAERTDWPPGAGRNIHGRRPLLSRQTADHRTSQGGERISSTAWVRVRLTTISRASNVETSRFSPCWRQRHA